MASYLQIENISKSYGPKILFEKIGFNINEGDKIALIAPNGTGKTMTLILKRRSSIRSCHQACNSPKDLIRSIFGNTNAGS